MPFYDFATDGLMDGPTDQRTERWLVELCSTRPKIPVVNMDFLTQR